MSTFWKTAMGDRQYRADLIQDEHPEQPDFGEMSAAEYARNRSAYVQANSDFLGAEGWSREKRAWQPPQEERAIDKYIAERREAGIHEAPDSTAMTGYNEFVAQQNIAAQSNDPRYSNPNRSI